LSIRELADSIRIRGEAREEELGGNLNAGGVHLEPEAPVLSAAPYLDLSVHLLGARTE